ncbi:MAG TPA: hypothetical protein VG871_03305 [Vicinamibacterales bacterium]|jgi:hypothetical protein|nr:hypothetical protein [Vicinamibacterales bacterium]
MKLRAWRAMVVTAALGAASVVVGCNEPGPAGNVYLQVTITGDAPVTEAQYEITRDGADIATGTIQGSPPSPTFTRLISHVPVGKGYQGHVVAHSPDQKIVCEGSTTFDVRANSTTLVTLAVGCHGVDDGMVVITIGVVCPGFAIQSLNVSPLSASVGGSIDVSATAPSIDASAATFHWSAPVGSFSRTTDAQTSYTCTTPGQVALTVTASSDACRDSQSVTVECVSDGGVSDDGTADSAAD